MKKCSFITLGCKVNQYETQAIREAIQKNGYLEVGVGEKADLYVVNTCTVTETSDRKSRQYIRRLRRKNPEAIIAVTGCYADAYEKEVDNIDEEKTVIIGHSNKAGIVEQIENSLQETGGHKHRSIFGLKISRFEGHTRAFLKIEDGCDNWCSYCIVPYVRGRVKSRPIDDVMSEAERLTSNGYPEIVLTGIHLGAYGTGVEDCNPSDNRQSHTLVDVLKQLETIHGLKRIRISSIEAYEITDELISVIADSEKICPHFHLPLQSGDNYILKRMNRKYTSEQYISLLDSIREKIKLPSFTTDVIIGFPGEEDEHFENTISTCKKAGFSKVHIFPFSKRAGTTAAKMDNHCEPGTISGRKMELNSVSEELAESYKQNFVDKKLDVLVESNVNKSTGLLSGYTERYIKVFFDGNKENMNKIVTVYANKVVDNHIEGKLI